MNLELHEYRGCMITVQRVTKIYGGRDGVRALDDVSIDFKTGEHTALIGASGSGKSTLLNIIGGIDAPTEGTVTVAGHDITSIADRELTMLRRDVIGIVFQFFNL